MTAMPEKPSEPGDEHDRFLRLAGADPAQRGGHSDAVKELEAKIKTEPYVEEPKAYVEHGILGPVSRPLNNPS